MGEWEHEDGRLFAALRKEVAQALEALSAEPRPLVSKLLGLTRLFSDAFPGTSACVFVSDAAGSILANAYSATAAPGFLTVLPGVRLDSPAAGPCGLAIRTDQAVQSQDVANDTRFSASFRAACVMNGILACYAAPIVVRQTALKASLVLCFAQVRGPTHGETRVADLCILAARRALEADMGSGGETTSCGIRTSAEPPEGLSASTLNALIENAPIGFAFFDREHRYTRVNAPLADVNGFTVEAHIGKHVGEILPLSLAERVTEVLKQAFITGEALRHWEVDGQTAARPGQTRTWITSFYPVFDGTTVIEVGATVVEITDRKRAELALQDSEARFRGVFESGVLGFSIFDARTGETLAVNDRLLQVTGHTRQEFESGRWDWRRFTPPRYRALDDAAIREVQSTGFWQPFEKEFIHKDGRRIPVRISSAPLPGHDSRVVVVVDDLTLSREAESALRRNEEQLRLATEAAEVGLWDVDEINKTLFWPPRVKAMFGIEPDDPVTMTDFYNGLHPEDRDRVVVAYAAATDTQSRAVYDVEYRTVGRDGVIRWVAAKGRGIFDEGGRCLRVIGTAIDISERKATQRQLAESEAKLRELNETLEARIAARTKELEAANEALRQAHKMEALGQLVGGIAHDFNNLLQGIGGSLELIHRKPFDQAHVVRWAQTGLRGTDRGARLTAQLLAFAREQKIDLRPFPLCDCIERFRDLLTRTIGPTIEVVFDLNAREAYVLADEIQIEMAVLNLALNARDAMPRGGTLTIGTRWRELHGDTDLPDGRYIELIVSDTGEGMPKAVLDRAFEPFFTTKGVGKGTGLGLSQVYGVVRQAGGIVRIDSEVGVGTAIRLLLKSADRPEMMRRECPREASGRGGRVILVVDDDTDVRRSLAISLDTLGHRPIEAEDGEMALAAFDRFSPEAVILDFAMPRMNGADLAYLLRQRCETVPIIFVTGFADFQLLRDVEGTVPILRKPFRIEQLEEVLEEALLSP